ncbi:hypothetical protein [Allobaculum sp. JKK-2023]|uniref:hypothetical protein n=1 Tax=Allobaculum sp. JKK-2023 TaxID=3108943 RepID=UPI002B057AF6|nr:hypothetical protein [Allobaculum sp. JKK-2023]
MSRRKQNPFNFQYPYQMGRIKAALYLCAFVITGCFSFLFLVAAENAFATMCGVAGIVFSLYGLIKMILTFPDRSRQRASKSPFLYPEIKKEEQTEKETRLPSLPKKKTAPEYQALLNRLENNLEGVQSRSIAVSTLIDEYFEGSVISSSRYKDVMKSAVDVLETNYKNACQAVELFGASAPTKARIQILQNYVDDSEDVVSSFDVVVNELVRLKQSSTIEKGDLLDQSLDELAATTAYYAHKKNNPGQ